MNTIPDKMRKMTFIFCLIIFISGCRTARYERHYKANLDQFSRLIGPVKTPQDYGDSIAQRIEFSIEHNERMISGNTRTNLTLMGAGTVGAIITPALPIGNDNKKLVVGISLTVVALSAVDMFVSITEPNAYDKKALEATSAWNNSRQDNTALNSLRASLLSLQETWPAYAP